MRPSAPLAFVLTCGWALGTGGCLSFGSEPTRHYWVLNTERQARPGDPVFDGLLRVRDLDAESAFDRFQLVLRKNPFELSYRQRDVWAVKPNRMLADILARTLAADRLFLGVTRELSERRPQYLFTGEIQAIEIIDRGREGWAVHLALTLTLSDFDSGNALWSFQFDRVQEAQARDFATCIESLSALTAEAMGEVTAALRRLGPTIRS